jgi:DNA-binding transcriptional LysR family regulator
MARIELSSINLNLLVALDGLLETRAVGLAAKRAGVTTSAMSHSLAALRGLFDDPLLVRAGGRMVLTPHAEALRQPLRDVLSNAAKLFEVDAVDPLRAARRFVIAAPDFLAALLVPPLVAEVRRQAPNVELTFVPTARRGNAWMLETGELDLALGAVVDDAPGILRTALCTERFVCAVREDHPSIHETLSLDQYTATEHLLITLGDDDRPTWIDEALARLGRTRRVAVRVRHFMVAPLVVARTDLLVTGPSMLLDYFSRLAPLRILPPPVRLPSYPEEAYWHARFDADPAHRWLRETLIRITSGLGTGTAPERRRWNQDAPKARKKRRRRAR